MLSFKGRKLWRIPISYTKHQLKSRMKLKLNLSLTCDWDGKNNYIITWFSKALFHEFTKNLFTLILPSKLGIFCLKQFTDKYPSIQY